jgi:hypothetical protein
MRRGGRKHITESRFSSGASKEQPGQASRDRGLAMTKKTAGVVDESQVAAE